MNKESASLLVRCIGLVVIAIVTHQANDTKKKSCYRLKKNYDEKV